MFNFIFIDMRYTNTDIFKNSHLRNTTTPIYVLCPKNRTFPELDNFPYPHRLHIIESNVEDDELTSVHFISQIGTVISKNQRANYKILGCGSKYSHAVQTWQDLGFIINVSPTIEEDELSYNQYPIDVRILPCRLYAAQMSLDEYLDALGGRLAEDDIKTALEIGCNKHPQWSAFMEYITKTLPNDLDVLLPYAATIYGIYGCSGTTTLPQELKPVHTVTSDQVKDIFAALGNDRRLLQLLGATIQNVLSPCHSLTRNNIQGEYLNVPVTKQVRYAGNIYAYAHPIGNDEDDDDYDE